MGQLPCDLPACYTSCFMISIKTTWPTVLHAAQKSSGLGLLNHLYLLYCFCIACLLVAIYDLNLGLVLALHQWNWKVETLWDLAYLAPNVNLYDIVGLLQFLHTQTGQFCTKLVNFTNLANLVNVCHLYLSSWMRKDGQLDLVDHFYF